MRFILVAPGLLPIPPIDWGAVESVVWDLCRTLKELGHEVQIINSSEKTEILRAIDEFNPDFVHVNHDSLVEVVPLIHVPVAITLHDGYTCMPRMNPALPLLHQALRECKGGVFCLTEKIREYLFKVVGVAHHRLLLFPNGVRTSEFRFSLEPTIPNRSIYLGRIEPRKRQARFCEIMSVDFVGPLCDPGFTVRPSYLGVWTKAMVRERVTDYGNLVLLSESEAQPLAVLEALAAGLGAVVSEGALGNLDPCLPFISVVPEDKIGALDFVTRSIETNREVALSMRTRIREYAWDLDWRRIVSQLYLPAVRKIIADSGA